VLERVKANRCVLVTATRRQRCLWSEETTRPVEFGEDSMTIEIGN
jgi:hypothetical protein